MANPRANNGNILGNVMHKLGLLLSQLRLLEGRLLLLAAGWTRVTGGKCQARCSRRRFREAVNVKDRKIMNIHEKSMEK
jgi:hypothetical protein